MAWSYVLPITTDKDRVRLLIGDTDSTDQQLQDEEIDFFVTEETNVPMAAGRACNALSGKYARQADKKMGDLSIAMGKLSEHYRTLADDFFAQGMGTYAIPSAGGVEISDRNSNQQDTSVTHSYIRRGMHDYQEPPIDPNSQS